MPEEENRKKEQKFQVVQVPTEFGLVIQTPDKQHLSLYEAIATLLNKVDELKKNLIGN